MTVVPVDCDDDGFQANQQCLEEKCLLRCLRVDDRWCFAADSLRCSPVGAVACSRPGAAKAACVCHEGQWSGERCQILVAPTLPAVVVVCCVGGLLLLWSATRCVFCCRGEADNLPAFKAEALLVLPLLLTIFDVASDVIFTLVLFRQLQAPPDLLPTTMTVCTTSTGSGSDSGPWLPMVVVAVSSIVGSFLLNLMLLRREFIKSDKTAFWAWFLDGHQVAASLVFVVACFNVSQARLLSSRVLGLQALDAPLNSSSINLRLSILGLVAHLVEDIPQLVIQVIYITYKGLDAVSGASIVSTSLVLLVGMSGKIMSSMAARFVKTLSSSAAIGGAQRVSVTGNDYDGDGDELKWALEQLAVRDDEITRLKQDNPTLRSRLQPSSGGDGEVIEMNAVSIQFTAVDNSFYTVLPST
jgi:hypothetical protein